jgi:hypothetical protein
MDLSIQPIGASLRPNPAPKGPGGPPSHENVISQFGQSLTEEQRISILKTISELQESGASFEEIKGVVDSFLVEIMASLPQVKEGLVDLVVDRSTIKVSFLN